jgi:hypothetical protein
MKTYQFYSLPLNSTVTVTYQDGALKSFEIEAPDCAVISAQKDKRYMLFYSEAVFLEVTKQHDVKVYELSREITFDMFWDKYNYKAAGGKPEAMKAWDKLSKKDKKEAFDYIGVYDSQLKANPVSKLYGSSYLNKKRWIK